MCGVAEKEYCIHGQLLSHAQLPSLLIVRPRYRKQIMPSVFILGYIYVHPRYRDMFRDFGPHQIPICWMSINIA